MKKIYILLIVLFLAPSLTQSQVKIDENFESSDSLNLPAGWTKWNASSFPIDPYSNWMVRDTGYSLPGIASATVVSHSGIKSCGATWYAAIDTVGGGTTFANVWLVTKRINVTAGDSLSFWATGGSTNYSDSLQIWVNVIDSLPFDFTEKIRTIYWPTGTTYGQFLQYKNSLSAYVGYTIWIGFRYCSDGTGTSGFVAQLDDVFVGRPIGIRPISTNVPKEYNLRQNYPNPFNPVTNIEFSLIRGAYTTLIVYDELGREVRSLVNESLKAGVYKVDFDASNLPSGAYFYRLTSGDFVKTNKMVLVK